MGIQHATVLMKIEVFGAGTIELVKGTLIGGMDDGQSDYAFIVDGNYLGSLVGVFTDYDAICMALVKAKELLHLLKEGRHAHD